MKTPCSAVPEEIVEKLFCLSELVTLDVGGWDVASALGSDIFWMMEPKAPKLKILHLPLDSKSTCFPVSRLQCIADACPELTSLHCRIDSLTDIPSSHELASPNLETLTICNAEPHPNPQGLLEVASYIDDLFPNLQTIDTCDGPEQNATQWKQIDGLVKFRQSGRLKERNRLVVAS